MSFKNAFFLRPWQHNPAGQTWLCCTRLLNPLVNVNPVLVNPSFLRSMIGLFKVVKNARVNDIVKCKVTRSFNCYLSGWGDSCSLFFLRRVEKNGRKEGEKMLKKADRKSPWTFAIFCGWEQRSYGSKKKWRRYLIFLQPMMTGQFSKVGFWAWLTLLKV